MRARHLVAVPVVSAAAEEVAAPPTSAGHTADATRAPLLVSSPPQPKDVLLREHASKEVGSEPRANAQRQRTSAAHHAAPPIGGAALGAAANSGSAAAIARSRMTMSALASRPKVV